MEVVRMPVGEQAPVDVDCIRIEQAEEALFELSGSALRLGGEESVAIVEAPAFKSLEEAEAAGLVWAAKIGVTRLFVSVGTLDNPLELIEIDEPL